MKEVGRVLSLFISKDGISKRVAQRYIEVDMGGILEDKFYSKDISRSVLITSIESYVLAKNRGIGLEYGDLGENILMDYNPYSLSIGTQFQIGEALFEITQNCTLCKSLSRIDNRLPKLLKNDRGIFAKVVKSGSVSFGDLVFVETTKRTIKAFSH